MFSSQNVSDCLGETVCLTTSLSFSLCPPYHPPPSLFESLSGESVLLNWLFLTTSKEVKKSNS